MKETTIRVLCPNGIHISPAGVMAKLLRPLSAAVEIVRGEARANAADIDEVLSLALREGEEVMVRADGGDEETASEIVCAVLREGTKMLSHFHSSSNEKKVRPWKRRGDSAKRSKPSARAWKRRAALPPMRGRHASKRFSTAIG